MTSTAWRSVASRSFARASPRAPRPGDEDPLAGEPGGPRREQALAVDPPGEARGGQEADREHPVDEERPAREGPVARHAEKDEDGEAGQGAVADDHHQVGNARVAHQRAVGPGRHEDHDLGRDHGHERAVEERPPGPRGGHQVEADEVGTDPGAHEEHRVQREQEGEPAAGEEPHPHGTISALTP